MWIRIRTLKIVIDIDLRVVGRDTARLCNLSLQLCHFYCDLSKIPYNKYSLILSLIHISEPTRPRLISYAVFCLKKFFFNDTATTEIYTV